MTDKPSKRDSARIKVHANLDFILEHSLLDVTSFGDSGGVLHEIAIGESWAQRGQAQTNPDSRFVRMNDGIVMNVAMVRNADRLIVSLHVTVEYVDWLQPVETREEDEILTKVKYKKLTPQKL